MWRIEWTEAAWNPVAGCAPIRAGRDRRHAGTLARRLKAMGGGTCQNGFNPTLRGRLPEKPPAWKKPGLVLVNSMSGLFRKSAPFEFIQKILEATARAPRHAFQILTKRPAGLAGLAPRLSRPKNVRQGVTVESADYVGRIEHLKPVPAEVRFLSLEPLLTTLETLNLGFVDRAAAGAGRRRSTKYRRRMTKQKPRRDKQRPRTEVSSGDG
ncbi:MAG: phage Gp37/Gp68 family protein [Deltaproteobacteria bacterium]|nr:phage Gp37/Gp68 family protein [Deltaproteobacteria bacterium]